MVWEENGRVAEVVVGSLMGAGIMEPISGAGVNLFGTNFFLPEVGPVLN